MPSEDGAGSVWKYRRAGVVVVVADKPVGVGRLSQDIDLQPGELVEITQKRQLEAGQKVFQEKL